MFRRWVIRHKPTGHVMPQSSRKKHGYTHDEPVPLESHHCPRLFAREQDAKTALTWWLKGETSVRYSGDYYGEIDEDWHTEPVVERKAEDFEVVPMELSYAS